MGPAHTADEDVLPLEPLARLKERVQNVPDRLPRWPPGRDQTLRDRVGSLGVVLGLGKFLCDVPQIRPVSDRVLPHFTLALAKGSFR